MSNLDDLKTLKELLDMGAISQEEYEQKKATLLAEPVQIQKTYEKSKIAAALFGILLGCLGIHKFYLGYNKQGIIMLLVSILTLGIGAGIMAIIGLVEGIIYITKTDEEFDQTYVQNQKLWF